MSLFFDNNSYNIEEEIEDDDPFYEIYDCHKTTYIEKKLQDPLNKFEQCEFAKEDMEDYIKAQVKDKPVKIEVPKDDLKRMKINEVMKPYVEAAKLVD